ncbi:MAG: T9SS type A sorting domain-containing protein [Flavobacterium sp.]|nr:T9SS type A sorting domain-containing protein [Flavobacterium sp.]
MLNSKITVTPMNMTNGIYFVKISSEDGTSESFKIIKQ